MKVFPSVVALVVAAAAANVSTINAQQTPLPPTPPAKPRATAPTPAPAPAAAPAKAPRAVIVDGDWGFGWGQYDAERISREATERAYEATARAQEASERAMVRFNDRSIEQALRETERATERALMDAERAAERAQRSLEMADWNKYAYSPMPRLSGQISTTINSDVKAAIASAATITSEAFAAVAPLKGLSSFDYKPYSVAQLSKEWGQDQDPADSLWRVANEAMNRGDYRRGADLFASIQTRYPKSNRISGAAYYEAYMRYRLGSTDELRSALRILSDKTKLTSTSSSFNNEVNNLTMRVRGALAQRGDAEQQRIVAQEAQKGGCDREDLQVRAEALSAIASSDMTTATPMLRNVLNKKDPCTLELRRSALRILLRRQDSAATNAAIAVAKSNDETLELRIDAVNALSRLPGENAFATLEDLLRTSNEREIQRAAVRALSNTENTKARSSVRAIIERNDVSEELRSEALNSFSKERNSPDDGAYLRGLFPKMQSERLKSSVLSAISRMGGAENDQFLLTVARNTGESAETRSSAISRLARTTSSVSVVDLTRLYDTAESRSLRTQLVGALSQRKEPEALDKLIDILKNSTDANVRTQVIQYLGRSSDPKAKQAIVDFANRAI
ncbi:MAG: HEAT repeat domain-containing protein [Gemmatimonas sp.]